MSVSRRYLDTSQIITFSANSPLSDAIFLNGGTLEALRIGRGWQSDDNLVLYHSIDGSTYKYLYDSEGKRVTIDNIQADGDIVLTDLTSEGLLYLKFERSSTNKNLVLIETIIKHK